MKTLTMILILTLVFMCSSVSAVTKCVGYDDIVILFLDKDNNNVYDKIVLLKTGEPDKVITLDEANDILKTFPEGARE